MAPSSGKGLSVFIADIRNCTTKDAERARIDKELAKIRVKFTNNKTKLSAYEKKKYVSKLLYIYMLGYDAGFGHIQAVNLCAGNNFSEKRVGYLGCSLLLNANSEVLRLLINVLKNDLTSTSEHVQALALNCVANIGGPEFTENLYPDVQKMLSADGRCSPYVRRKAIICFLRLYRTDPKIVSAEDWVSFLFDNIQFHNTI